MKVDWSDLQQQTFTIGYKRLQTYIAFTVTLGLGSEAVYFQQLGIPFAGTPPRALVEAQQLAVWLSAQPGNQLRQANMS